MDGSEFSSKIQELVRSRGDEVAIDEPPCVLWKSEHENCRGCKYQLGCGKTTHLMGVMLIPLMYEPKNFADHQAMSNRIQELMDMTLKAKTVGELKLVPFE